MLVALDFKKRYATILGIILSSLLLLLIWHNNIIASAIVVLLTVYLLNGGRSTTVYACIITFPRDVRAFIKFMKLNFFVLLWDRQKMTVPKIFQKTYRKNRNKIAFIMDDIQLKFNDVEELSNQIGGYFKSKGYKKGDTIALLMENRPEYPCLWLGLSKIGIITALINTNLKKDTLLHSIKVANSKAIIVSDELSSAIKDIQNDEEIKTLPIYQFCDKKNSDTKVNLLEGAIDLRSESDSYKTTDLSEDIAQTQPSDKMVYIYTSGTTGMPKAAVITNMRGLLASLLGHIYGIQSDDIIYTCLPLYHAAGSLLGVGNTFVNGVTVVIRKKFSASQFWTDCIKYNCTVAQYIGELCRYLLLTPEKPTDCQHKIKMMYGNGLRPQIWEQFVQRFQIKNVVELYASTEGNTYLMNFVNKVGAIGFIPLYFENIYPGILIKCNEIAGKIIRNDKGKCVKCKPGEPGIFIGEIEPEKAHRAFDGYVDKKASEEKILKDVFKDGDYYFNSGDILIKDIFGFYYFKDRTGDTFRWKGENVSTSEVEAVISNIAGLKDCVVYGVKIPNVEGKAGMVTIVDSNKNIDFEKLSKKFKDNLPAYAKPIFIRIVPEIALTGTFKLKKGDLQRQGYDIHQIEDKMYILQKDGTYKLFTEVDYENLKSGKIRV